MKVNVPSINVTLDGPTSGYLNVYKRTVEIRQDLIEEERCFNECFEDYVSLVEKGE